MPSKLLLRTTIANCLLVLLIACSGNNDSDPLSTSVSIDNGELSGQASDRASSWEWLGIPYAEAFRQIKRPPDNER